MCWGRLASNVVTNEPQLLSLPSSSPSSVVVDVACGDDCVVVLSRDDASFVHVMETLGATEGTQWRSVPLPTLTVPDEQWTHLYAGMHHFVVVSSRGRCASWGCNNYGQLGLSRTDVVVDIPEIVDALDGLVIRKCALGAFHSLFLSDCGDVYVCGGSHNGQLGLGDRTSMIQPQLLECFETVCDVAAGHRHSVFVCDDGNVFASGCNQFGQCGVTKDEQGARLVADTSSHEGIETLHDLPVPHQVDLPKAIANVYCGPTSTFFLPPQGKI